MEQNTNRIKKPTKITINVMIKYAKRLLPKEFDYNRKQGFSIPLDDIFRSKKMYNFFILQVRLT